MLVKCNKIISPVTKKDLGAQSPWLKRDKEYVVLALDCSSKTGIEICIQTEHHGEPSFFSMNGFEMVSQKIPSSWTIIINEIGNDEKIITMLPKSWAYEGFFEAVEEEEPEAVALFNKEAELIYKEEGV